VKKLFSYTGVGEYCVTVKAVTKNVTDSELETVTELVTALWESVSEGVEFSGTLEIDFN